MLSIDSVLAEIRSEVCDTVLKWTCVFGALAVVLSLSRVLEFGFLPVMAVHVALVSTLVTTYMLRQKVPYGFRAGLIVVVMFVVAAAGHAAFGTPMRIEFFIAASIMATVFFGEKTGMAVAAGSIATLAAIYNAFSWGILPAPAVMPPLSPTNWIANGASMLVAALAPLIAVNRFRRHLNRERERVVAASRAKSDFLATMSHELRTPMTAILGMTDLLLTSDLPATARDQTSRIAKAGKLLLEILNDILDLSKIESNKIVLRPGPFNPRELVEEICALFTPVAAQRQISLQAFYENNLEEWVVADSGRIRQTVLNLVGNAVKFTERGGVVVRVWQEIRSGAGRVLKIEVKDTGIGISAEQQALLFQPFVQVDQAGTRRYGGTGLGLSISRRLVELMRGEITLHSKIGEGSTFAVSIPVGAWDGKPLADTSAIKVDVAPSVPLRILVAEDNESISFLLTTMLRKWGHDVHAVPDGKAALTAAAQSAYDVILMDMQMPIMDGARATREIRKLPGDVRHVPIIALTADIVGESTNDFKNAGANALLAKPVNWHELADTLTKLSCRGEGKRHGPPVRGSVGASADVAGLPILDQEIFDSLRDAVGAEAFTGIVISFAGNLLECKRKVLAAIDANDAAQVRGAAHALKGLCAQFGAQQVAGIAADLERGVTDPLSVGSQLSEAFAVLESVLAARMKAAA